MKRFLLQIVKYAAILLVIVHVIAAFSLWIHRQSAYYKPSYLATAVQEEDFDYIILGSSTGLTTLNSIQIDTITGLHGINLSMDDSSLSSHYLMLSHFLDQGKTTRKVVLSISEGDLENENPTLSGNDYRFLPWVSKPYVQEYYNSFSGSEANTLARSASLPMLGVSRYNSVIFFPAIQAAIQPKKRNRFDAQGNYVYPNSGGVTLTSRKETNIKIKNPFYTKLKTLCEENYIELILYQPPIANKTVTHIESDVLWINHSAILNDGSLFYDTIHVNAAGRTIASERLSQALLEF